VANLDYLLLLFLLLLLWWWWLLKSCRLPSAPSRLLLCLRHARCLLLQLLAGAMPPALGAGRCL
jgi:hypothetical protein